MNWFITGIFATIAFGFFGLFYKLSTFQESSLSNLEIYFFTLIFAIILVYFRKVKLTFSKDAFVSGLCEGVATITLLLSLVSNYILTIFPFVSFSSVFFFFIILASERPKLSNKQKILAAIGIILSITGLFIASTGTVGGISSFLSNVNSNFLLSGFIISIGFGLWSYFSYVSIKKKTEVLNANFWMLIGSFVMALIAFAFIGAEKTTVINLLDSRNIFLLLTSLSIVCGIVLTLKAYKTTTGKSKIQETIIAILSNAELIPLIFLSYFVLNEFITEGIVGAIVLFIGISLLKFADNA